MVEKMAEIRWTEQALDYDSKLLYEDHLSALQRDSKRVGSVGGDIDYALLLATAPIGYQTNLRVFGPGGLPLC